MISAYGVEFFFWIFISFEDHFNYMIDIQYSTLNYLTLFYEYHDYKFKPNNGLAPRAGGNTKDAHQGVMGKGGLGRHQKYSQAN